MAKDVKPKQELTGISKRQIDEHFDVLYQGYVKKANEIGKRLTETDLEGANATYHPLRELKREELFAVDSMRLHEWYFENLGAGSPFGGPIQELIEEDYKSYDDWAAIFKAVGMCARGWTVLAFDWQDRKLHTYMTDVHHEGMWQASPLLVLDCYEHAYMIDYGTARAKYIDAFMQNINWDAVNARLSRIRALETRKAA
ncbi:MAG: superoxide dismutase [Actinobacteria bacterium]|nr:MAG: superoxide dismutase [Actinomycetota bacterium]